jgi:hypothetical protein
MKGCKLILFTPLILCIVNTAVFAQEADIVTDRPDQSNTPLLVPKGALQVETGFMMEKQNSTSIDQTNYTYNNSLIKFGINEHFEFRFNVGYVGTRKIIDDIISTKGLAPIGVGVKIKLADAKGAWPQAAVISNINLRAGGKEFMPAYTANDITFACAHELSKRLSFTYNAGIKWNGNSPEATFIYTMTLTYAVTNKLGTFAEVYAFFPEKHKTDHRVDGGLTYKFSSKFQYDLSGGLQLGNDSPDFFLSTGLSFRLFK